MKIKTIYQAIVFCALLFFFASSMRGQCTFTSTVPFSESFGTLTSNNQLPTCWSASAASVNCLTFTSPSNCAAFYCIPSGSHYFYTNGIFLNTAVTYSVNIRSRTDNSLGTNWSNLTLQYGQSQSSISLTTIAQSTGVVTSSVYIGLGGSFTVASSGIYYFAISASGNSVGTSPFLYIDDFSITTPCSLPLNTPTLNVLSSAQSSVVCASTTNQSNLSFTVNGASSYTWVNGSTTSTTSITYPSTIVITPTNNFFVVGTNSITGCTFKVITSPVQPVPFPVVSILATSNTICLGSSIVLTGSGASTYSWIPFAGGSSIAVSPTTTSIYSLVGSNAFGCTDTTTISISPVNLPALTFTAPTNICIGEQSVINLSGANVYSILPTNHTSSSGLFTVMPIATSVFTIVGTDQATNCNNSVSVSIVVDACLRVEPEREEFNGLRLSPNPCEGSFLLQFMQLNSKEILVTNSTGQLVYRMFSKDKSINVNLSKFPKGAYYVHVITDYDRKTLKVLFQ